MIEHFLSVPNTIEKSITRSFCQNIFSALLFLLLATTPALGQAELSRQNIANSALNVAESTHTTGRCYAAVSRALHPLGVQLSGAAACQAQDILLKDSRFVPLAIHNVDELRRGDIVVYTRSSTHPYGHISVYEGNYEEASDHLAPITHTQAYGAATVFRLRSDILDQHPVIAAAPDYTANMWRADGQTIPKQAAPVSYPPSHYAHEGSVAAVYRLSRNNCLAMLRKPIERSLARLCQRFLLR